MSGPLNQLLEHVLEGEPEVGDEVDAIFRRAARLRRRRTQAVLLAGAGTAGLIVALGYLLTATLLDSPPATVSTGTADVVAATTPPAPSEAPAPAAAAPDGVLAVIEPLVTGRQLTIGPAVPGRGDGWREYDVVDARGRSRGTIQVAIYDVRKKWCFPVAADPEACARTDHAGDLEFVRYDDVSDANRQVRQTIARRINGRRALAVMAAGEQNAGAERGRPALTGAQVEQVATDERVIDAFGKNESCADGCPPLATPVG